MKTKLGKPNCLRYQPALESPLRVRVQLAENELPRSSSLGTLLGTGATALAVGMAEELGSCPAGFSEQHSFPVWGYTVIPRSPAEGGSGEVAARRGQQSHRDRLSESETPAPKPGTHRGTVVLPSAEGSEGADAHALNQPLPSHE